MIDPISAYTIGEALSGITAGMSGLDLAGAWSQQGFVDPIDAGYDLDFGVKVDVYGSDKPAISGNTGNSISDSTQPTPVDAFNDYVENNPSSVSGTTGGIVSGSNASSFPYSLLETFDETTGTNIVKAVVPVAVPVQQAYIAISQALGVSMDAAQMEVETKQKFANSIIDGQDLVYDKAKGLVKAWYDGVHILFPKKTVQAVKDTIDELGIGGTASSVPTQEQDEYYNRKVNYIPTANTPFSISVSNYIYDVIGDVIVFQYGGANNSSGGSLRGVSRNSGSYKVQSWNSAHDHMWNEYTLNLSPVTIARTGQTFYMYTGSNTHLPGSAVTAAGLSMSVEGSSFINQEQFLDIIFNGNSAGGGYPDGTEESIAAKYTPSTIPSAGGIATSNSTTEEVVPISLPTNPDNTFESPDDPVDTPTDPDDVNDLPAPPIPLPIPDTKPSNPDVPLVNPSIVDSTLIDQLIEELANTLDPQPGQSSGIIPVPSLPGIFDPSTGHSTFPSIIPSSGPGFIHVYNPTPAEFIAFGNWLWVTYADATIDKILNNPFDGVIGAHELYATPNRDGRDNIRSAFLTCPTTADLVMNRYSEIDCGTVIVPEFYGNYLDYSPYSQAYIYLPFIGINEVSIDDIVGHAVNIRYRIDSYSGSCIAMIFVAKDGYQNLCYQFAGSCSVEVPMAGGSQAAIKAGMMQAEAYARAAMIQAGANVVGGIGSALMGNIGGVLSSLSGVASNYAQAQAGVEAARVANKSSVQHSGQFGSSHGAMGQKIPFIIIRNPIQVKVVNYNEDYGFPAHKRVIVGGCKGYLRVREVNVISAHATDEEKMAIEMALKGGVYVS